MFHNTSNDNYSLVQVEDNIRGTDDNIIASDYGITPIEGSYIADTDVKQYLGKDHYGNITNKNPFDETNVSPMSGLTYDLRNEGDFSKMVIEVAKRLGATVVNSPFPEI